MFLDLCSSSSGDQDILFATVDISMLPQLLLLFGGVYHNTCDASEMEGNLLS